MLAIKAIAFDLEGPLVDFEQFHFSAHTEAAKQLLHREVDYDWMIRNIPHAIGGGDRILATGIARHYGNAEDIEPLLELKNNLFAKMVVQEGVSARPGAIETVEWFIEHGYFVTIGSNTPAKDAFKYLHETGLNKLIKKEYVVLTEHVNGKKKPEPDIYLETARRVGVEPKRQIVVDDSATGLEAAVGAGSFSIATPLHRSLASMDDMIRWSPRRIIHDWREVNLESMMSILDEEIAHRIL